MQRTIRVGGLAVAIAVVALVGGSQAQTPPAAPPPQPPQFPNMTFFVTSVGGPQGANYGGLEGADRHCQTLAAKAGAGAKTWHAYLSTQAVGGARRQCQGPHRQRPVGQRQGRQIAANVADLHPANNKIGPDTIVAESGRLIPTRLYTVNQHDILTGSQAAGTAFPPDKDMTCGNWTKSGKATRCWATPTAAACATTMRRSRGTPRTPRAPATRRLWWRPAAPACSIVSRPIETPLALRIAGDEAEDLAVGLAEMRAAVGRGHVDDLALGHHQPFPPVPGAV